MVDNDLYKFFTLCHQKNSPIIYFLYSTTARCPKNVAFVEVTKLICIKCHQTVADGPYCCQCGHKQSAPVRAVHKRGNGQGTAIKRGSTWTGIRSGYTTFDVAEDGTKRMHRIRPSKGGFKTKKEALAWASADTGTEVTAPKLIELWDGYKTSDFTKLSDSKKTAYKIARTKLEPIISKRIDEITLDDIQSCINEKCSTYYPARDMKTVLSKLYQRAMASNSGLVLKNLSEYIVLPDLEEKEANPFSADDLNGLWTAYNNGDLFTAYILIMCYTGMMPGELLQCKRSMVDTKTREIRNAGLKTKTRRKASIVYPEFLDAVMSDVLERKNSNSQADNSRLICINKDNFYSEFYRSLKTAKIDNTGRKYTPYSCRHTFGTEAVKAGLHPAVIQKMLRHSNTQMQQKYTHLADSDVHDAVNQLAGGLQVVDKSDADSQKS